MPKLTDKLTDLGWANDWEKSPVPEEVKNCKHKKQFIRTRSEWVSMVICTKCGWFYSVDSSG